MPELLSTALGCPVVAADTAETVGEVKALVLGISAMRITQIHVAGRSRSAKVVNWEDLAGFGTDAVMVALARSVTDSVQERTEEVLSGRVDSIGARILDTSGFERGTVVDVEFDPESGAVVSILGDSDRWDRNSIHSLGRYALIVDAAGAP